MNVGVEKQLRLWPRKVAHSMTNSPHPHNVERTLDCFASWRLETVKGLKDSAKRRQVRMEEWIEANDKCCRCQVRLLAPTMKDEARQSQFDGVRARTYCHPPGTPLRGCRASHPRGRPSIKMIICHMK